MSSLPDPHQRSSLPALIPVSRGPVVSAPAPVVHAAPRRRSGAPDGGPPPTPPLAVVPLLLLAGLVVGLHAVVNRLSVFGLHRDELLYLAMGRHLDLWSMDFPPWIALLAEATRAVLGSTDVMLRMGPAAAHAALMVMAAVLARYLRGNTGAQLLAALAVATSPLFLRAGHLFQPVVFDQLWWTLALLALVKIGHAALYTPPVAEVMDASWTTASGHRRRLSWDARAGAGLAHAAASPWMLLGIAGGLGLLTKFSILFLGAATAVALLVGPLRRTLRSTRPWLVVGVTLLLGAPSLVGQMQLGWPVAGQLRQLRQTQLVHVGVLEFLGGQLMVGPAIALAAAGVYALFTTRWARPARTAALAAVGAFLLLLAMRGKPYYAGPIYPLLFAAGAVFLEQGPSRDRGFRAGAVLRLRAAAALLLAFAGVTLPVALPMLSPAATARWVDALGLGMATRTNTGASLALPQDFADMLGWPELARAVGDAYAKLPPAQQADVTIVAANYGQAGALEFYAPRVGIPGAVSPAGSFWFWGPGERVGDPLLTVGVPASELTGCARLLPRGRVTHPDTRWQVPEEQHVPLYLGEGPSPTLQERWPSLRSD